MLADGAVAYHAMNVGLKLVGVGHSLKQLIELAAARCIQFDAINRHDTCVHADAVNNATQSLQLTDSLTRRSLIRCLLQQPACSPWVPSSI